MKELFDRYVLIVNDDYSDESDFDEAWNIEAQLEAIGGKELIRHLYRHQASDRFGRVYTGISNYGRPQSPEQPRRYLVTKAGKMHGQSQKAWKLELQRRALTN